MHNIPRLILTLTFSLLLATLSVHVARAQDDEDKGRIYWSRQNSITRAKMDGSDPETLLIGVLLHNPVFSADGSQMYGIGNDGVIRRANIDGSGLTELLAPGANPKNLLIDPAAGKLYWLDNTSVRRANLDGSVPETLVGSQTNPGGLRLDTVHGKLYWVDDEVHLRRANLDGTMLELVYTASDDNRVLCPAIDPIDNRVYWMLDESLFQGPLMRANADGSGVETLPLENFCPVINIDNRKLYWVHRDPNDGAIQRSNLDGSNIEVIVADADAASNGLTFDQADGKLYWYEANTINSKIRRASLDGGPAEDLVPMSANGQGLFLNVAQQKMLWMVQGVMFSSDLQGNDIATVLVGINVAGQLALDLEGDRIFWGDASSIRVAKLDSTDAEVYWTTTNDNTIGASFGPNVIAVDAEADKLYWITLVITPSTPTTPRIQTYLLMSGNLDGSGLQEEGVIPFTGPFALDLAHHKVYGYQEVIEEEPLPQQSTRELASADFDGSGVRGLGIFDNLSGFNLNLAVDGAGGKVYWTVGGTVATIQQANLDGSGQSEFMAGLNTPGLLQIDHKNGKIYWTNQPGGDANSTERANLDGTARETVIGDDMNAFAFDPEGLGTPLPPAQVDQNLLMPLLMKQAQ